ncbi:MAG TPA: pyridoxal-dependent decarboxylase [Gaiellaceae bacterium]|nr:pyridoxal-dependent decarboxylase [Gaiellaceae bacterium]
MEEERQQQRELLRAVAEHAAAYLGSLDSRPVFPRVGVDELRARLGGPLPEGPQEPKEVIDALVAAADPGIVSIPGGRYFGFVIGGSVPAALAADWLTSTWDQNAGLYAAGPSASVVEEVCLGWLRDLLGLPGHASGAFVTGCQMAHVTALAAARWEVLRRAGWDVNARGLAGAPPVRVLTGDLRHVTVDRALRLLGVGADAIESVPTDEAARMRPDLLADALAAKAGPTIVCAQAGEVNTGAFDPLDPVADACAEAGAWLHVDGAFGLWAAATPGLRHLVAGAERADSWATDAHKWLNVPYDSGIAFCAHPEAHRAAMSVHASYLVQADDGGPRDEVDWTPEFSRRARGFPIYAALRSLGRSGVAALVERCCAHARGFADRLAADGAEILNDVVLNQVLVSFGDDARTDAVLAAVRDGGTCFMSGTTFRGRRAMRISVSNWQTTEADVDASVAAILAAARR